MRKLFKQLRIHCLTMRFSGGAGGAGTTDNGGTAEPATEQQPQTETKNTEPPKTEAVGKTYSETDLELARQQAVADYKLNIAKQKSYDEMTAEEKVAYLEKKQLSSKLEQHTARILADNKLSVELLPLVKGESEADISTRVKLLKELLDKEVQAGVAARFKDNAYQPRGSALGGGGGASSSLVETIRGAQVKRN